MSNIFQTRIALAAPAADAVAASQSPGAGAITLDGSAVVDGVAVLDTARRVLLTSGGDDSGITFTVNGANSSGNPISETLAGANVGDVYTSQDFQTVTSVTHTGTVDGTLEIGTNDVASSRWFTLNYQISQFNVGIGVVVDGTVNYTVEYTYDDVNAPFTGDPPVVFGIPALTSKSANLDSTLSSPSRFLRVTQNSGSSGGEIRMIAIQSGIG